MTSNQKYIYKQLLNGGFITITPTANRQYTLYDTQLRPLKRLSDRDFSSVRMVYGHQEVLKKIKDRFYISRNGVRSLRKNTWLREQYINFLPLTTCQRLK